MRLMVCLAAHADEGPVGVDVLSKEQAISSNYIHVLMGSLTSAGLARSLRGPNGGYELSRNPGEISALDVVTALEGKIDIASCLGSSGSCARSEDCATRDVWSKVASAVETVLGELTLDRMARSEVHSESIEYYI